MEAIMQFLTTASVTMAFLGLFVFLGYVLGKSQKESEIVDTRMKLFVFVREDDGSLRCDVERVRDQDDAQQILNLYMFSRIKLAYVVDPMDSDRQLATMDQCGRLVGV